MPKHAVATHLYYSDTNKSYENKNKLMAQIAFCPGFFCLEGKITMNKGFWALYSS